MKKTIAVLNLISVIFLIAWNGYANTGNYNGKSVGNLSAEYSNLFTPASYAFSIIWGLIFLMLLAFSVYGVYYAFAKAELTRTPYFLQDFVKTTTPWFLVANIFCSAWVMFWLDEMIGISVLCMLGILICLLVCVKKVQIGVSKVPRNTQILVWWPLSLYTGWISVATIANIAAYLNGTFEIAVNTQVTVTIVMIIVAFLVNVAMVLYRNMRVFAMVGVWALVAIYMRYETAQVTISKSAITAIGYTALSCAFVLSLVIIYSYVNKLKPQHDF